MGISTISQKIIKQINTRTFQGSEIISHFIIKLELFNFSQNPIKSLFLFKQFYDDYFIGSYFGSTFYCFENDKNTTQQTNSQQVGIRNNI